jgi:N-carbamoylputrescine amidase
MVIMDPTLIRAAAVQFHTVPGDIVGNLSHAEILVEQAAAQGAQIVLLPELTPGGYLFTQALWDSAETNTGKSVSWLMTTAKRLGIHLGMSYLEVEASNFYNSFLLVGPDGEIAGRVRKNPPASAEAYFFAAGNDPHYIDTRIGRIGVSICYEALLHERLAEHQRNRVDILLIPMSAATPNPVFPLRKKDCVAFDEMLMGLATHHARALGVPVIMANKCGPLVTAMPGILPFLDTSFPGLSTIANARGETVSQLDNTEGIAIAEITFDASKNAERALRGHGRWALPVPWFSFMFPLAAYFGARDYARSSARKKRAIAMSQSVPSSLLKS